MGPEVLRETTEKPHQRFSSKKERNIRYILPEGVEVFLTRRQLEILESIIKAGEKGISTNTLAQDGITQGMREMALVSIRRTVEVLEKILSNTPRTGRISKTSVEEEGAVKKGRPPLKYTYQPYKEDDVLEQAKPINTDDSLEDPQQIHQQSETFALRTRKAESNKTPEQIIGGYSVFRVLLNLTQDTLDKVPQNIEEHLNNTLKTALEEKLINSNIIENLSDVFVDTSEKRLERFFRVNFLSALELWEIKTDEAVTKEDKSFAQIFEDLKSQGYTKEQVTKEVLLDHFGLKMGDNQKNPTSSPAL